MLVLQISGKKAQKIFKDENGGHRWQRVPPTENKGRIHTSTITVAVVQEVAESEVKLDDRDLELTTCRGSGAGGQHRNTTDSAVQIKHTPSGLKVRCESERSQHQNKLTAMQMLRAKLQAHHDNETSERQARNRKKKVGSGMRGDKIRTIRQQDGQVCDHVTGKTWRYKDYVKGIW